jgi:hypothetical protein
MIFTSIYSFQYSIKVKVRLSLNVTKYNAMKTYGGGSIAPRTLNLALDGGWSRESSVGIALGYGLDDWGSRVRFPAVAGNFSLHHRVHNGSGAQRVSYPVGTRGPFPGVKGS